jgi:hypothetical protein
VMFRTIFIFFSLTYGMIQCIPVALHNESVQLVVSIRRKADPAPGGCGVRRVLLGGGAHKPQTMSTARMSHKMGH